MSNMIMPALDGSELSQPGPVPFAQRPFVVNPPVAE
jgi:hypothetical protein